MSGAISAQSAPHATIDGRPFWSFGTDSNCSNAHVLLRSKVPNWVVEITKPSFNSVAA
jgi:hypothetical protein